MSLQNENAPQWHPATDTEGLQNDKAYLVAVLIDDEYELIEIGVWCGGVMYCHLSDTDCNVTHWMELPEPPERK